MSVRELIEELLEMDAGRRVWVVTKEGFDPDNDVEITSVEIVNRDKVYLHVG